MYVGAEIGADSVKISEIGLVPISDSVVVVCDGSVYDASIPYLFVTLGNHTVHALDDQDTELGFDATGGRMISCVSLHDRCGVFVAPPKHASVLQNLGYPVVHWGQTVAFPMCSKQLKRMGVGVYPGALVVHTFTEPISLHNRVCKTSGNLGGDGNFDGLNHLSGAYIPLALALHCATVGDTHVNLDTKNSGLNLQKHSIDIVIGGNFTSLCFKDKTGGSIVQDDHVVACANCATDHTPLVVGKRILLPGWETLIQEMSGCSSSFMTKLVVAASKDIGTGVFAQYDKQLEADIRSFASSSKNINTGTDTTQENVDKTTNCKIDMCKLPEDLQTSYCTTSMVAMMQPCPIGAPTIVVETDDSTSTGAKDVSEADKYGDRFSICSWALAPHFRLPVGTGIHQFFGIVALIHALVLSQISPLEAYMICKQFARKDSEFLSCEDPLCDCTSDEFDTSPPQKVSTSGAISEKFERMLNGVSQNIALSNTAQRTPRQIFGTPRKQNTGVQMQSGQSGGSTYTPDIKCKATTTFCGTCKCQECVGNTKLIHLAQLVASCTHAFQKCDNYTPDQTACSVTTKGVIQYRGNECMLPFGTVLKAVMMKTSPTNPDDVALRVGMNTDDCENCAFETMNVLNTLSVGSSCVSGKHFHRQIPNNAIGDKNTTDEETIRHMRMGNLSKQDQRRILLVAQVIGENVKCHLGYFVTGSPSQANDIKKTQSHLAHTTDAYASPCGNTAIQPNTFVELPSTIGDGLNAFGCKPPGQRISYNTNTGSGTTAGLGGHCTCTLSVMRKDGFLHTNVVEGTAHVHMGPGDIPCELSHRGTLSAVGDDDKKIAGAIGYFKGPINIENAVDVTIKGLLSSHILTISNRMQVPGSTMRPCMFMGTSEHVSGNMDSFYKKIVSTGTYQCVQLNKSGGIQPGADVKKYVNQRVLPIVSAKVASMGEQAVLGAMGNATCAMVETVDTSSPAYKKYEVDCMLFSRMMSPLRFSPEDQDRYMLSTLGSPFSLKVKFPDEAALLTRYGNSTHTSFVTHVAVNDTVEGRHEMLKAIQNHVTQINSEYVNVRVATPIVTDSGEVLTLFKIFGVKKDPMLQ
jgi:hypothetical protein